MAADGHRIDPRNLAHVDSGRGGAGPGGGRENERGRAAETERGRAADKPSDLPASGWKDVAWRVKDEIKRDRVPLVSAGVAFYAMLALFPALTAFISTYGLVADPAQVERHIEAIAGMLQGGAGDLITEQVRSIADADRAALSTGFAVSLLAALWSASSGTHGLMQALTVANNEEETRSFFKRRGIALGLTLAGIVFFAVAIGLVVVLPVALGALGLGTVGEWAVRILRWPLLAAVVVAALATMYRYGPDRDKPQWRWTNWGAAIATLLWILGSFGFSVYVARFGNYNETYGTLGAVIVLLLWLFLSAFVVLLGAEINAEMEHQTAKDTTTGEARAMGDRDAQVADHVGEAQG